MLFTLNKSSIAMNMSFCSSRTIDCDFDYASQIVNRIQMSYNWALLQCHHFDVDYRHQIVS